MPASSPEATPDGISRITRSNQPDSPSTTKAAADTT
jgi:hypothetical protein